jgi:hypothetical protein
MISSSDAARALAKLPRTPRTVICEICGEPFATVGRAKRCSDPACKRTAAARQKAARRAALRSA